MDLCPTVCRDLAARGSLDIEEVLERPTLPGDPPGHHRARHAHLPSEGVLRKLGFPQVSREQFSAVLSLHPLQFNYQKVALSIGSRATHRKTLAR